METAFFAVVEEDTNTIGEVQDPLLFTFEAHPDGGIVDIDTVVLLPELVEVCLQVLGFVIVDRAYEVSLARLPAALTGMP